MMYDLEVRKIKEITQIRQQVKDYGLSLGVSANLVHIMGDDIVVLGTDDYEIKLGAQQSQAFILDAGRGQNEFEKSVEDNTTKLGKAKENQRVPKSDKKTITDKDRLAEAVLSRAKPSVVEPS